MGALAHYFEGSGLATTQVSLVREHTETISPPRALWVSFPLGRPFGIPGNARFQRNVLHATLNLLQVDKGPVLTEYAEEIPGQSDADAEGWACPIDLAPPPDDEHGLATAVHRELETLLPWYNLSHERRGRTTVGASGLPPETAIEFVGAFLDGQPEDPRDDLPVEQTFKQCVEDLKALYAEAATNQPGIASPKGVETWFWNETTLGAVLLALHQRFLEGSHAGLRSVAEHSLVPRTILEDRGLERPSKPRWHTPQ